MDGSVIRSSAVSQRCIYISVPELTDILVPLSVSSFQRSVPNPEPTVLELVGAVTDPTF